MMSILSIKIGVVTCISKVTRNRPKPNDDDEKEDVDQNANVVRIGLQKVARVFLHLNRIGERHYGQS
jgi:hypothetical protein